MPAFRIRLARPAELERIREIERAAGRQFDGQGVTRDDGEPTPLAELEGALRRARLFVAAAAGDVVVGWARLEEVDGGSHLHELDVDPPFGRRGIGRALVEHVCAWSARRAYPAITLTTYRDVPWNRPFYERCGFSVVSPAEIGPQMRRIIEEEIGWGLDWRERCVMRRRLRSSRAVQPVSAPQNRCSLGARTHTEEDRMGFALSDLQLTSKAFRSGEAIPKRHTGEGEDVSPPLAWSHVPDGTEAFALVCHDPDAPLVKPGSYGFAHWVLYDIPGSVRELPEGVGEYTAGRNDFGAEGYGGPMPPEGHGRHHYFFWLLALGEARGLEPGLTLWELLERVEPHVIGMNRLVGTYQRS